VELPAAEDTVWTEQIPDWPSDGRFAQDVYPSFVQPLD
jgi:hypothetical protein